MSSAFPSRAKLSGITQMTNLNRSGLVADCIFPQVKTDCKFSYINWEKALDAASITDSSVTCKSDVHQVDEIPYELVEAALKDEALSQVLTECCVSICGEDKTAFIEAGKTKQLINKLLVAREKKAIDLALLQSAYTNGGSATPGTYSGGTDGVRFQLTNANLIDPNFGLLRYLMGINENRVVSGQRNVMVTDLATLNKILAHPNFIGSGCIVDPMTTSDKVAALLGLSKICIADATYNNGTEAVPAYSKLWTAGRILFTTSYDFVTSQDETLAFGISAYNRGFKQYTWLDEKKGPEAGVIMQKVSHDFTPVVLSRKAATVIEVTF